MTSALQLAITVFDRCFRIGFVLAAGLLTLCFLAFGIVYTCYGFHASQPVTIGTGLFAAGASLFYGYGWVQIVRQAIRIPSPKLEDLNKPVKGQEPATPAGIYERALVTLISAAGMAGSGGTAAISAATALAIDPSLTHMKIIAPFGLALLILGATFCVRAKRLLMQHAPADPAPAPEAQP